MQKQAEALTTTTIERLRELYASSRKMTAGVVFGTGNGMLQEEVRDEVRARELRKASKLNAAARKKKKDLWELSLEVESTRLAIAEKHEDYFRTGGFASADDVKESDLTEAMIRTLKNDQLKTLCKWKKRSNDAAMPTNKEKLAARLIETMGRSSPNTSPYNSDDENEEFDEDLIAADGSGALEADENVEDVECDEEVDEDDA